jgi:phosphoribosyl-ATP pyrophosphohydrolase/phosphoribosyl-AMP cyclohydrolase
MSIVDNPGTKSELLKELMLQAQWDKGVAIADQQLLPAVVQCRKSGAVLMLGYFSPASLHLTFETGDAVFFSRSRSRIWRKGETSGNTLKVHSVSLDCDGDTFLVLCDPLGPTCHTGAATCFFKPEGEAHAKDMPGPLAAVVHVVYRTILERSKGGDPDSYTFGLMQAGRERILKKLGEEATETVIAAMSNNRAAFASEAADLLFHLLVAAANMGVPPDEILEIMADRQGQVRRDGSIPKG